MRAPSVLLLLLVSACAADKTPVDSADTGDTGDTAPPGPTRERRAGRVSLAEADLVVTGEPGDGIGTSALVGSFGMAVGVSQREEGRGGLAVFGALPQADVGVAEAETWIEGATAQGYAGVTLAPLPGGGLALGAFWDNRGGVQGGAVSLLPDVGQAPAAVLLGAEQDYVGISIEPIGDDALVIGAFGADWAEQDEGHALIVPAASTGEHMLDDVAVGGLYGEQRLGWLGVDVDAADLDGDGIDDLVAGAMGEEGRAPGSGVVYVVYGPVDALRSTDDADAWILGEASLGQAGKAVAAGGDVDGDGLGDVLIGAPNEDNAGNAYLLTATLQGERELSLAQATLEAEADWERGGFTVAFVGDQDGDDFGDVLVGASRHNDAAGDRAGAAYLLYGPLQGTRSLGQADWIAVGEGVDHRAGVALGSLGDLDGDGFEELFIGATGFGEGAGAVYVWY
ncbi:MAG: FG-GAP repeat protein [Alphaproteobacteria bacterium]|nr:FG-GAP repeat protein [Alphaproteobacteria bacterium]